MRLGRLPLRVRLVVGFAVVSKMGNLHPRYLESFRPAVAGTVNR